MLEFACSMEGLGLPLSLLASYTRARRYRSPNIPLFLFCTPYPLSLIFCPDFEFSAIFIVTSFLGVFTSILPPNIIVFSGISTSLYRSSPSLSYSSLGAIFTVSIRSPRPPLPLPFMRSFSPSLIPFGIFILMFSPLKFIECSPPH